MTSKFTDAFASNGSLHVRFMRRGREVSFVVIRQAESLRNNARGSWKNIVATVDCDIRSSVHPSMNGCGLYICGCDRSRDGDVLKQVFCNSRTAATAVSTMTKAIESIGA